MDVVLVRNNVDNVASFFCFVNRLACSALPAAHDERLIELMGNRTTFEPTDGAVCLSLPANLPVVVRADETSANWRGDVEAKVLGQYQRDGLGAKARLDPCEEVRTDLGTDS